MFQGLRRFLSIGGHPQPSNRVTPSQNRHINSLPTELLIIIFQICCSSSSGHDTDPVLLSLICRLWHAIVTGCPALWSSILFERTVYPGYLSHRSAPIQCRNWSSLERAVARAGDATLSLVFHLGGKLYSDDDEERVLRLFARCRDLDIIVLGVDWYRFSSSITIPHLEHLELDVDKISHIEPLLDSIERGSPLLRSLFISSFFPNLARYKSLLGRIVRLNLFSMINSDIFFQGLQNLEELTIFPSYGDTIRFLPSYLPKLVSLCIGGNIALPANQQPVTFPLLKSLKLSGKWSNLQFIAAPKLRNLALTFRVEPEEMTLSSLRRSTVRPMSLSTEYESDVYLTKLPELWSNLSELHLQCWHEVCIPGPVTTVALAGSRLAAPLCPSLRYLTVHMEKGRKDSKIVKQSIQRLTRIVKKRKGHGDVGLQRVMCVWGCKNELTEVEWVDVL